MDKETGVQSQVESYQRLKKWYLILRLYIYIYIIVYSLYIYIYIYIYIVKYYFNENN